jgi:hypothetical protein
VSSPEEVDDPVEEHDEADGGNRQGRQDRWNRQEDPPDGHPDGAGQDRTAEQQGAQDKQQATHQEDGRDGDRA